ncbi:MAG: peptidoglycan-binding domain-containing protein [Pseudomonadota bacterium]
MTRILFTLLAVLTAVFASLAPPAAAQSPDDIVWVQIEAQPSLSQATDRARAYAAQLEDVNGFFIGGGWYAIAVGPYRRADAEQVRRAYVRDRIVPRDAFIQQSSSFRQQFWPVGANVLNRGVLETPNVAETPAAETPTAEAQAPAPPDETLAEARRSERALTGQERRDLQVALQWAGFYTAAIDGSFGRGTRRSMSDWQAANTFEPTGVLTTLQRTALLGQYNAVLDGLDLGAVRDDRAGIEMLMPRAEVAFARYEAPFAQYDSAGDIGARVLLISQEGDQNTLFGLYDIMQTLEIVPFDGPRTRRNRSFSLKGENDRIVSETEVSLEGGQIKGFTLVWPAGDEARRIRVMEEMRKSFARLPSVLDAAAGADADQAIDLVSGLQVRQPKLSRSGFFIDPQGAVLTSTDVIGTCGRLTVEGDTEVEVIAQDVR